MLVKTIVFALAGLIAGCACAGATLAGDASAPAIGYRNLFATGLHARSEAQTDAKLQVYWQQMFEGGADTRVYYPAAANANGPAAYILDTGNSDVRTEGMSYGMMIAVQMNKKAAFDALWNWAYSNMRYATGPRAGYFRWQCLPKGCGYDAVPASDGEEYFATALFFAAHRWGNGKGVYDYEAQANAILDTMLHKEDMNGGVVSGVTNMFNHTHHQVVFVPHADAAEFSDPSYHLPAFYELWGRWAKGWNGHGTEDRAFWCAAAAESRRYFDRAADTHTALTADYAGFDGMPVNRDGHGDFRFDAFRSAVNWSVDYAWWHADASAPARSDKLQAFFAAQGMDRYVNQYRLDGAPLSSDRSTGLIASNAVASLAATNNRAGDFVEALWTLEPPAGQYRYYNGLLQFFAMLHVSGRFRAW